MSAASQLPTCNDIVPAERLPFFAAISSRVSDYREIVKPRISLMVLLTVSCGYVLATESAAISITLLHACVGIAVVAIGSSAINQWIERDTDRKMQRTSDRPLPSGRLSPTEVFIVGFACAIFGSLYLAWLVNLPTALMTGLTFVLYAGAYTPLKRVTSLCTVVGAIPGALPPVLGWLAAGGQFDQSAFALFGILFLWQFPHFFAIAWLYRDDYCQAGLRMLPAGKSLPHVAGLLAVTYAVGLIPVSLLPAQWGMAGTTYLIVAATLGLAYLMASILFAWNETRQSARRLLWTSLIYLPVLLLVMVWDHQRLLGRF